MIVFVRGFVFEFIQYSPPPGYIDGTHEFANNTLSVNMNMYLNSYSNFNTPNTTLSRCLDPTLETVCNLLCRQEDSRGWIEETEVTSGNWTSQQKMLQKWF